MWKTLPKGGARPGYPRDCAEQSLLLPILKIYPGSILHQNYRVKVIRRWQAEEADNVSFRAEQNVYLRLPKKALEINMSCSSGAGFFKKRAFSVFDYFIRSCLPHFSGQSYSSLGLFFAV
jgi:hypothetical protein